ncbi:MAG: type I 3-dehydroquinate dehydratase [Candidatus Woesearchaeota archaeon]|nr:type I 3-dehydroquinate dehydratase [Candidatus Woesearchaeota archaeon]
MTLVAVSVGEETIKEAIKSIKIASEKADIVEIRLDYLKKQDLEELLKCSEKPVILTCMPKKEGGRFSGSENERAAYLQKACDLGVDYVTVELNYFHLLRRDKTKLIVAYHDINKTPENLGEIYKRITAKGADIAKLAVKANTYDDVKRMMQLIGFAKKPIIGISIGELGRGTRIHPKNYLTFAALSKDKKTTAGQFSVDEIRKYLR